MARLLREGEGQGGGGAGQSFYKAPEAGGGGSGEGAGGEGGGAGAGTGDGGTGQGGGEGGEGAPEWLMEKYLVKGENDAIDLNASAQKQAEAYRELYGRFSKKTDDLRAEVMQDAVKEYGKTIGVPEDIEGYQYPEGVQPPDNEELDKGFREWALKHNVSPQGFNELISEVYAKTFPDYEKELEALGPNADARLETVNKWASKNLEGFDKDLSRLMTTASGVAMVEKMMQLAGSSGFAPDDGGDPPPTLTREQIREMQADPRFGQDESYTAKVRKAWKDFAKRNGG